MASPNRFLNSRTLAALFWYALGLLLVLLYLQWAAGATLFSLPFPGLVVIAGLLVLALFFPLMHAVVRGYGTTPPSSTPASGAASALYFPLSPTVTVGIWLLVFSVICVVGLFMTFLPQSILMQSLGLSGMLPSGNGEIVKEALLTLFAAGIGSSITTILGYLQHASEKKDFSQAYVPWYIGRPLMGMLLGLIFYFVLKGGLLATVTADGNNATISDLNDGALAAIGAMVGLFSKNAIEKLRQVFQTLFQMPNENGDEGGGAPDEKPKPDDVPKDSGTPVIADGGDV